jgi:hypothetical protein
MRQVIWTAFSPAACASAHLSEFLRDFAPNPAQVESQMVRSSPTTAAMNMNAGEPRVFTEILNVSFHTPLIVFECAVNL